MTPKEIEILLKTVYKGEGAQKALSDMDKISASGAKTANVLAQASKAMGGNILGVQGGSAAFRRLNPHLFTAPAGGGGGGGSVPPNTTTSPMAPGGGRGPQRQPYGGLNQFQYRAVAQFGLGRAAAIGGIAGGAGALVGLLVKQVAGAVVKGIEKGFEDARRLYAKSLTSGLGLQMTAKRGALAEIIGVSEKEIFQFGQVLAFIGNRADFATNIFAKTTPNLAAVSYEFKILKMNLEALFATIANDSAPALRKFASGLSEITKALTTFFEKYSKMIKLFFEAVVSGPGTQAIIDAISRAGKDSGPAPNPVAYMQQIHASALEHMGLIVGGIGHGTDFAAQTAQNTKATVDILKGLAQKIRNPSDHGGLGNFGFNPLSSNP